MPEQCRFRAAAVKFLSFEKHLLEVAIFLNICFDSKFQGSTLVLAQLSLPPHKFAQLSCECYGLKENWRCDTRMTCNGAVFVRTVNSMQQSPWLFGLYAELVNIFSSLFGIGRFFVIFTAACRWVHPAPAGSSPQLTHRCFHISTVFCLMVLFVRSPLHKFVHPFLFFRLLVIIKIFLAHSKGKLTKIHPLAPICVSVFLSTRNQSRTTKRIFMIFDTGEFC
jgi:hypothetical protein